VPVVVDIAEKHCERAPLLEYPHGISCLIEYRPHQVNHFVPHTATDDGLLEAVEVPFYERTMP